MVPAACRWAMPGSRTRHNPLLGIAVDSSWLSRCLWGGRGPFGFALGDRGDGHGRLRQAVEEQAAWVAVAAAVPYVGARFCARRVRASSRPNRAPGLRGRPGPARPRTRAPGGRRSPEAPAPHLSAGRRRYPQDMPVPLLSSPPSHAARVRAPPRRPPPRATPSPPPAPPARALAPRPAPPPPSPTRPRRSCG